MSYDQNKDEVTSSIDASDLPDAVKQGVNNALANAGETVTHEVVDSSSSGGAPSTATVMTVTEGGEYASSSATKAVFYDTDEDTTHRYYSESSSTGSSANAPSTQANTPFTQANTPSTQGAGSYQQVIVLGGGDDSVSVIEGAFGSARVGGSSASSSDAAGEPEDPDLPGLTVEGAAGNDSISGSVANDHLAGGTGDDSISGAGGDDILVAGSGNDTIDGGSGFDIAQLQAGISSYEITVEDGQLLMVNATEGEAKTVERTEYIQFDDGTNAVALIDQDQGDIARLYEIMFDRAAEAGGLEYWLDQLEGGMGWREIAARFADSDEYRSIVEFAPDKSNAEFLDALYVQAFEREADESGKAYWLGRLDAGEVTRTDVIALFAESEEAQDEFDYIKIVGIDSGADDGGLGS